MAGNDFISAECILILLDFILTDFSCSRDLELPVRLLGFLLWLFFDCKCRTKLAISDRFEFNDVWVRVFVRSLFLIYFRSLLSSSDRPFRCVCFIFAQRLRNSSLNAKFKMVVYKEKNLIFPIFLKSTFDQEQKNEISTKIEICF